MAQTHSPVFKPPAKVLWTLPLRAACLKALTILEGEKWQALSPRQDRFLTSLAEWETVNPDLGQVRVVSSQEEDLSKVLEEKGFFLRPKKSRKSGFSVLALSTQFIPWPKSPKEEPFYFLGNKKEDSLVPGLRFEDRFFAAKPLHDARPLICLPLGKGLSLFLSQRKEGKSSLWSELPHLSRLSMVDLAEQLSFDAVCFPALEIMQTHNLSWLKDLQTTDREGRLWHIHESAMETWWRLGAEGIALKGAVLFGEGMAEQEPQRDYMKGWERPFSLWIRQQGVEMPIAAALVGEG